MRSKLSLFLVLSLIVLSMADDSSESSDDDHKKKEDHSKDDPKDAESKGKDKKDKQKEEKNKNTPENDYDDDEQSQWSAHSIDEMFLGKPTQKPTDESLTEEKTTIEPPQGLFGPNYYIENAGSSSTTAAPNANKGDDESNGVEGSDGSQGQQGSQGSYGSGGNPFFPYPRPIDVWDRLLVLVAFPVCFFAVMLKAEMFR
ncbi:hypothetical protein CAEBREN_20422 [Caenorhabditis brenneri]|uniref:Uncharacterized protein n=1 Tax=Caenorhabditis brenneri TaxID=135651 RepID=G0NYF5_CAEBE|nr:hypothetical protein CAEBREN_20422 [Caenorhabditis brenneri]